ncbi:hypothetical protein [Rhodohalobacter sp.]|uniref:hypothetical protein n=1 Tax=Rhodohalobacter sp. TaxID=1974210 RepID=UPI002ACE506A|nr:hypothetical protein [Rhodohalobacter sp.]MDZ7756652.1 hypothetical protein [Rhodohalobacter sp.]
MQGTFITDLDVTEDGFIAVAINDLAKIQVYNIDGELKNEFGRGGRGPGDFRNLMSIELTDSLVFGMDSGPSGRINAFQRTNPEKYQTFQIPRSTNGSPVRMWLLDTGLFLVEFRHAFNNRNINEELKSTYELISITGNGEKYFAFDNKMNEMFINQSNGGFSVSSMAFGRQNFIVLAG